MSDPTSMYQSFTPDMHALVAMCWLDDPPYCVTAHYVFTLQTFARSYAPLRLLANIQEMMLDNLKRREPSLDTRRVEWQVWPLTDNQ